jgi:hypothetical protein
VLCQPPDHLSRKPRRLSVQGTEVNVQGIFKTACLRRHDFDGLSLTIDCKGAECTAVIFDEPAVFRLLCKKLNDRHGRPLHEILDEIEI